MGDFITPPANPILQKENGGFIFIKLSPKLQSVSNRIGCQKKKEPITAFQTCVLSALRLCVWLFDN